MVRVSGFLSVLPANARHATISPMSRRIAPTSTGHRFMPDNPSAECEYFEGEIRAAVRSELRFGTDPLPRLKEIRALASETEVFDRVRPFCDTSIAAATARKAILSDREPAESRAETRQVQTNGATI